MKKKILILVNKYSTILNFRLEVVKALVDEGYDVFVSVPFHERVSEIKEVGATIIETPFNKDGMNPFKDYLLMKEYRRIIRNINADLVLTYTIKPNVYGGMAASLEEVPYVANITGLGNALANKGLIGKLSIILYKIGFRKIYTTFFQNDANRDFFKMHNIPIGMEEVIPGSGVNLDKFSLLPYEKKEKIEFAYIARIMKEKGIDDYLEAAKIIQKKYDNVVFHVCGYGDECYENKMLELHKEGAIVYHGLLKDVRKIIGKVHCIVHPTYYPEGMSNTLLESAACGRPIISTNRPGTREVIDENVNGYFVKEKNVNDLVEKLEKFIELSYEQKYTMGINGRHKVEKQFDRKIIVEKYLEKCREILER